MDNKIKEQEQYIKDYNQAIERGEKLLSGLLQYDKNIINKTFFEKFFTRVYTPEYSDWSDYKLGEPIIRNGKKLTEFYFSDKQYSFQKGKRIYLAMNEYIEDIETNEKSEVIEKTKEKIAQLCNNRDYAIKKRDLYKAFKIEEFKAEYKKLLEKYNGTDISSEVHEEIKWLN